jgi:signal transduction histidine kinase
MRFGLSTRIFAGFLTLLVAFAGTALFAVDRIGRIREDLRLVHRGYLAMARQATQVRTLQEAKDEYVRRALGEDDPAVRRHLVGYAREFYPRALRDRLAEMQKLADTLAQSPTGRGSQAFLNDVAERLRRTQRLHDAYDEATVRLLASIAPPGGAEGSEAAPAPAPDPEPAPEAPPVLAGEEGEAPAEAAPEDEVQLRTSAYEETSEALSREVRALSIAMETRLAESLLRAERDGRDATLATIVLSLVALVVGLGILAMMTRALRPLQLLLDSARAIGRGSLDVEVPIETQDEVGALAREFNAMARALRDRETALEGRGDELLRLKSFSDDVIRSVRVGIVILDAEGRVLSLNPAARSVFQLPLMDLEGRSLRDAGKDEGPLAVVLDELQAVQQSGEVKTFPLLALDDDRVVDVALVPVRDRTGASTNDLLLLGEDVTVRENTRERLVQSERLAAIGRLAAQITHEIRNPLSSIGLNIELLGDDVEHLPEDRQEEAAAILGSVGREVSRLTQITEGYLRYARLPAPKPTPGDVGDLLADLCAFNQSEAEREGVMLELQVDDGLPAVPHDAERLRQALLNLVKNAQEAVGRGGTVRCVARRDEPTGGVRLIIEDSGPGVPEEVRERLFQPFFTTKSSGTGLGLTLTREIVEEHQGTLALESSTLGGAAFHILLPPALSREPSLSPPPDADRDAAE